MKKIISLVLVLVLVLGTFSFAFAETVVAPADVTDADQIEAVEVLMALGVVDGYTDGTYKPAKVVTRAEMAKLIISLFGYEDLVGGSAPFTDTAGHWGEGYVALASGLGLVNGYPDGTFKPDNTVSFDEAITMVVRALGYTDESLTGTWPTNYKIKGINIDLLDDVDVTGNGADRGNVALMLYNALDLTYGEVDADDVWNENTDGDDGDSKTVIDKIGNLVEEYQITYDDVYDDDDALDTVIDLAPYLYHIVDYYENADEDIAFISDMYTVAIALDTVAGDENVYTADDSDDDSYTVNTTGIAISYNYAKATDTDDLLDAADDLIVIFLDEEDFDKDLTSYEYDGISDEDGEFDADEIVGVIATTVTYEALVDDDYDEDDTEISVDGDDIELPIDDDDDFDESRLVVMGDVDSVEDIMENDVVEVYEAYDMDYDDEDGDSLTLVVTRDVVEGELEEIDEDDETATIDGVELDYTSYDDTDVSMLDADDLGEEYTVYLNAAGEIAFIEDYEGTVSTDYAVAVATADGDVTTDFSDIDVDDYPQIKVFTSDEDVVIYDIDVDLDDFDDGNVYVGDLELSWAGTSTSAIVVENDDDFENVLVQYEIDSDGYVTEVNLASEFDDDDYYYDTASGDSDLYDDSVLDGDVIVVSSTLIFDITEGNDEDEDDWDVIDMDDIDLGSSVTVKYLTDADDTDVIAMIIDGNDAAEDGTYALLSKITLTTNSDDDVVAKLVGFLDGEAVTLLTDKDTDDELTYSDINEIDELAIYELTIEDDEVTAIELEPFNMSFPGEDADDELDKVLDISSNGNIKVADGYFSLDDDVIVYEVTFDDGDLDTIELGSADDIDEDDYVIMYDTDNESDGDDDEIDIIIYISEDEAEDAGYINN